MLTNGIISGGMVPKIEASLKALTTVPVVRIIDGRMPHALLNVIASKTKQSQLGGTTIVPE